MIYLILNNSRNVMVKNLLVKMKEEDYLILRALLETHDLQVDEFMDLITSNTEALENLILQLTTKRIG